MARPESLLILGPTGSGKTPLGQCLERHGLNGRPCVHFDFGARLRAAARMSPSAGFLSAAELATVRACLRTGALLENETFGIAAKILTACLDESRVDRDGVLLMNGLPRHRDQARDVDRLVRVRTVVILECTPEVVSERIGSDAGGDRTGRTDDVPELIRTKLATYRQRTLPLIEYYGERAGVRLVPVEVDAGTSALDVRATLEDLLT
jgi:adenylate kinase family enzyme